MPDCAARILDRFWCAAGVAVDGALFVASGAVVFLLGYGGEIGGVVFGRHGYGAEEEADEGWVLVKDGAAFGVDVKEIEGGWGRAGAFCKTRLDAAKEEFEDRGFEGVDEKGQGGGTGQVEG